MKPPRLVRYIAEGKCRVKVQPPYTRYVVALVSTLLRHNSLLYVLATPLLAEKLEALGIRVEPCDSSVGDKFAAILWCNSFSINPSRILVIAGVETNIKGLNTLRLRRLEEDVYLAKACGMEETHCIRNGEIDVCDEVGFTLLQAYNELKQSFNEYGALRLQDAVTIVSATLGVKRSEARRIVIELSRKGFIKIVGGHVIVRE